MAKVLFITSSWRKKSNSNALAAKAALGAKDNGHDVKTVEIGKLNIGPCRACMGCLKDNSGRCVTNDDMKQFYPLIEDADTIVFASPVYWFNLSGQIKQFIDRCYALGLKQNPDGSSALSNKKIGLILAHEGEDPFISGGINAIRSIQDTCFYLKSGFAGALYGCANDAGEAEANDELLKKAYEYGVSLN